MIDVAMAGRGRNIFKCDLEQRGLGAEGVEHIRGEVCRQTSENVVSVVRVLA